MAGNLIAVYDKVADPIAFAEKFAVPAASLIGCDVNQGAAMALQALSEGVPLMALRRRYHWIQGAPSMRADAMRAEFRMNWGGDFEIVEDTPECASIKFTDAKGREKIETVTWEQALGEPWPWASGCGPGTNKTDPTHANLKTNWATPLSRANMLIARATSRGLRKICPELVAGIYTPEELADLDGGSAPVASAGGGVVGATITTNGAGHHRPTAAEIIEQQRAAAAARAASTGDVIDGEVVGVAVDDATAPTVTAATQESPRMIRRDQIKTMNDLASQLFQPEEWERRLAKAVADRHVSTVDELTADQAKEIIGKLRDALKSMSAAATAVVAGAAEGQSPN